MKTKQLHELGQSLWLDNITRGLLDDGTLRHYIEAYAITGLTSNPTIFEKAIGTTSAYDAAISEASGSDQSDEAVFEGLALEDLRGAADLFRPVFDATGGSDGWVSMELSPLLANDTAKSIAAAARIYREAGQPMLVKIPGTPEGVPAIEESIFAGVPINVTLLFSREQYLASAQAYLRGIERRLAAGRGPAVASVASLFVSRWDVAVHGKVPHELENRLGIAVAGSTYQAYREMLASPRWRALAAAGARPQLLLWASTGTKDPQASDTLYIEALAAPDTIDTIPEKTLHAFAEHGELRGTMAEDGGDATAVLERFVQAGIVLDALATRLQQDGAKAFTASWKALMERIASKRTALARSGQRKG